MQSIIKSFLVSVILWGASLSANALTVLHTLVVDPVTGFTETVTVPGCAKYAVAGYGVKIYLFDDGTYEVDTDFENDGFVDTSTYGYYQAINATTYYFMPDGNIGMGTSDSYTWGGIFSDLESIAQYECGDPSIYLLPSTTNIKAHVLKVNGTSTKATATFSFEVYGYSPGYSLMKKGKLTQKFVGTWN